MKAIWTQKASYHDEIVNFDRIWSWPKPVQNPHAPILLGSHGPRALQRVVRYCDGWLPNTANRKSLIPQITELRRSAEQGGRDPKSIPITAFGAKPECQVIDPIRSCRSRTCPFLSHSRESG
jgi:alkanesulfonate monooxygenase SsuD/methylene tetrahydromethanopterin reductase-like flavin-dependent oxidoreductase (luciferase family)